MSSRNLVASILTSCLLAAGGGGLAPAANAASAGQSVVNPGASVGNSVIEIEDYGRGDGRFLRPIGPSYLNYDYPYYYSRGYYPTHIGAGRAYYGNTGAYERDDEDAGSDDGAPYSAKERCSRRFRSFEWDTGHYTTYGGHSKLCPYLR
jgi:hypothetical protein